MHPELSKLILIMSSLLVTAWVTYISLKTTCKYLEDLAKRPGDNNLLTINRNMVISNWTAVILNILMFGILLLYKN